MVKIILSYQISIRKSFHLFCLLLLCIFSMQSQCLNVLPQEDCDGDGVVNFLDLDDDNDGILDTEECGPLSFDVFITQVDFETSNLISDAGINTPECLIPGCTLAPKGGGINIGNPSTLTCWEPTTGIVEATKGEHPVPSGNTAIYNAFAGNPGPNNVDSCRDASDNNGNGRAGEIVVIPNIRIIQGANYSVAIYIAEITNTNPFTDSYVFRFFDAGTSNLAGIPDFQLNNITQGNQNWQLNETDFMATETKNIDIAFIQLRELALGADIAFDAFSIMTSQCSQDVDNDGIPDVVDMDSDNDGCLDVTEYGATDNDGDGILGDTNTIVDADGLVTNGSGDITGGYSNNNKYTVEATRVDYSAPNNQEVNSGEVATFEVPTVATSTTAYTGGTPDYNSGTDVSNLTIFEWFDGDPSLGGVAINNNATFSINPITGTLSVNALQNMNGKTLCVRVTHPNNLCFEENSCVTLTVNSVPPVAQNDIITGATTHNPVTVNVLADNGNGVDTDPDGNIDPTSVIIDPNNTDGDGDNTTLNAPGEGVWNTTPTGEVIFTPETNFTSNPTSITYTIADNDGNRSNEAVISIANSTVEITENNAIKIYNLISPNDDGINDFLVIENIERFPNNTFEIYNRWGSLVYKKESYNNEFNGLTNASLVLGSSNKLPEGTYYYVLDIGNSKPVINGWLYLNR